MAHPDPGPTGKQSRNAGDRPKNIAPIALGAVVVLLVVLGLLFLGGDDDQTVEGVGTSTTDVIEPGAADGGSEGDVGLQDNAAGTDADPAVEDAPAGDSTEAETTEN